MIMKYHNRSLHALKTILKFMMMDFQQLGRLPRTIPALACTGLGNKVKILTPKSATRVNSSSLSGTRPNGTGVQRLLTNILSTQFAVLEKRGQQTRHRDSLPVESMIMRLHAMLTLSLWCRKGLLYQ